MADSTKSRGANKPESATDALIETTLVTAAKLIGLLAWWAVRFPLVSTPIAVVLTATVLAGVRLGIAVTVVCAISYGLWCYVDRESFHRLVWDPLRESWMTWWRYKRSWEQVCTLHHLTAILNDRTLIPPLQSVTIGATVDVLTVRIVTGQCVADWQKHSDALARGVARPAGDHPPAHARQHPHHRPSQRRIGASDPITQASHRNQRRFSCCRGGFHRSRAVVATAGVGPTHFDCRRHRLR